MNYFAHALCHLDRPYFVAGVALPDWMNIVDRKVRVRSHHTTAYLEHEDRDLAEFAAGISRHHADDLWFHKQPAFVDTSMRLSLELREELADDPGLRAGFLGHILVELLLDAYLIERAPEKLDRYYRALESCNPGKIQAYVVQMAPRPTEGLAPLIPRFIQERFLADYADDESLKRRLNQVMRRVGLPLLPNSFVAWLPKARQSVYLVAEELFPPPASYPS